MPHPNRINFTDDEVRLLDALVSDGTLVVSSGHNRSTLQMLRGKARIALGRVEQVSRGEEPALAPTVSSMTADVEEAVDTLRATMSMLDNAMATAKRRLGEMFIPLGDALQQWKEAKTLGADKHDDALLGAIDELESRVARVTREIETDIIDLKKTLGVGP